MSSLNISVDFAQGFLSIDAYGMLFFNLPRLHFEESGESSLPAGDMADKKEVDQERIHFFKIVQALKNYPFDSKDRIQRTKNFLKDIPVEHQRLLNKHSYQSNLVKLEKCIDLNTEIINGIIEDAETMFENQVIILVFLM